MLSIPLHLKAIIKISRSVFQTLASDSHISKRRSCHIQALVEESGDRTLRRMLKAGHCRKISFSSLEAALLLVGTKNRDLWPGPTTFRF